MKLPRMRDASSTSSMSVYHISKCSARGRAQFVELQLLTKGSFGSAVGLGSNSLPVTLPVLSSDGNSLTIFAPPSDLIHTLKYVCFASETIREWSFLVIFMLHIAYCRLCA